LKILLVNGYSYLGKNIAEKLINLKHEITIIDLLSKGRKGPIRIGHKFFNISPYSPECEKVFESSRFDAVIYISETLTENCNLKNLDNYSGLNNILKCSAKSKIKKFILLVSYKIYGSVKNQIAFETDKPKPLSKEGLSDNVREYYVMKSAQINNFSICLLRIAEFYGAYDDYFCIEKGNLKTNLVFNFINDALLNGKIIVEDKNKSLDFIYIEDVVEAVANALTNKNCSGIYNISTGLATSLYDLANLIIQQIKTKKVEVVLKQSKRILTYDENLLEENFCLSNELFKKDIGWNPKTKLSDGIEKTVKGQVEVFNKNKLAKKKKRKRNDIDVKIETYDELAYRTIKPKPSKAWQVLAFFENIILFLIFSFLQWGDNFFKINLPDIRLDYLIVYILLVAIIWGQVQAYIAMILSSFIFVFVNFLLGVDIITFFYMPENLIQIAIYLIIGVIAGYSIERKNREIESRDNLYANLTNKYMFLLNVYNQTKLVKKELESQIVNTEDSFSTIYNIIQEVNSLEIESVFSGAVSAIEKIMKTDKVSIYTINWHNGNAEFIRLKARSVALADKTPNSIKISDFPQIEQVVKNKSVYINKDFNPNIPVMIAPIIDEKKVIAIISIHDTAFENLTKHYENLFLTIVGLISDAIKRAYYFAESLKDKRYIKGTKILNEDTFEKILNEVKKHKESLNMSYSLLKVKQQAYSLVEISNRISSSVRDNDYIGIGKDGNIYILLSNTKNDYANVVIERLKAKGIISEIVPEEVYYE